MPLSFDATFFLLLLLLLSDQVNNVSKAWVLFRIEGTRHLNEPILDYVNKHSDVGIRSNDICDLSILC